jgi:tRNA modification GTPase
VLNAIPKCSTKANPTLIQDPPIRYASPGEFTRLAFLNDRLSLPQIESLGDTLAAETEQQRRLAVHGTTSSLGKTYQAWQKQLLYARGELEALIDFSEDQHFDESPRELVDSIAQQVLTLKGAIKVYIENAAKGELMRNGINVALLGAPNAGKSSLLNRILGREAAIVSTEEGTTRDIVDVGVDIGGWFCRLGDMAGLRAQNLRRGHSSAPIGEVEKEGIRRAKERALASDVVIVVLSLERDKADALRLNLEPEVIDATRTCLELNKQVLIAINKTDLSDTEPAHITAFQSRILSLLPEISLAQIIPISCKPAQSAPSDSDPGNIQRLLTTLTATFTSMSTPSPIPSSNPSASSSPSEWEPSLSVTHRQQTLLQQCLHHLNDFLEHASAHPVDSSSFNDIIEGDVDIVAAAEHLRFAASCLARITGRGEGTGDVEEVLGVVFEKYVSPLFSNFSHVELN